MKIGNNTVVEHGAHMGPITVAYMLLPVSLLMFLMLKRTVNPGAASFSRA